MSSCCVPCGDGLGVGALIRPPVPVKLADLRGIQGETSMPECVSDDLLVEGWDDSENFLRLPFLEHDVSVNICSFMKLTVLHSLGDVVEEERHSERRAGEGDRRSRHINM